ncbi:uncharacterized protein HMPREF1541_04334 [Cyphellophora europaea CBS 101466]|uniref:eIF-2-alpha kinase activator GCN1 n=1 Tax=Cyphellophora europaea (strain CBS 101466) TaxID=1220924 RepID=W2RWJ2_CYPE1|nr:uncharacterized protein HMPREF1541_04334 [Cyphellophora europaea CBS 101466]ETN40059.1 hypothetical protein HMPREF1541_04334 [Cyphellophora europaea CBS 101466]
MEEDRDTQDLGDIDTQVKGLRSGSTRLRTDILKRILHNVESTPGEEESSENYLLTLLPHVLETYPLYKDRLSRKAVENVLRAYLRNPSIGGSCCKAFVTFLVRESQKPVVAPSNAFVLLEWCCLAQEELAKNPAWVDTFLPKLCAAAAACLDKTENDNVRNSVQHSSLVAARRGLRAVLRTDLGSKALPAVVNELTSGSSTSAKNAQYLGVVAGVSFRIPERKEQLGHLSSHVLDFYVKHVLNSKTAIARHQAYGMRDFFSGFVGYKEMSEMLMPAIEKSILRSAEVVLQGPLVALAECLEKHVDISALVQSKLIKPLLSSMASTNANIRDGAGKTLAAFLARGVDDTASAQIAADLTSALKAAKVANHELRGLISDALLAISPEPNASKTIVESLLPAAAKEVNEVSLRKELSAMALHLPAVVQSGDLSKATSDALLKNCSDKRPVFRKCWHLCFASALLSLSQIPAEGPSRDFVSTALGTLKKIYEEILANPLPATQTGIVAAAYALPALLGLEVAKAQDLSQSQIFGQLLNTPTPSFLLNSRVYSKLSNAEDQLWALRALRGVCVGLGDASEANSRLWARAILHIVLSSEVDQNVRREAGNVLSQTYLDLPGPIGRSIISGVWDLLQESYNQGPQQSPRPLGDIKLHHALNHIMPAKAATARSDRTIPASVLEKQAVDSVTLLRPELIAHTEWIASCLSMGIDPGELASKEHTALLQQISAKFDLTKLAPLNPFEVAAGNAAASLAFVAPDTITPILARFIAEDLDPRQLDDIGPTEATIARAPEGQVFVDVLAQKPNGYVENKNVKDYDIMKWEEEMRTKLAQKKGPQPKKLTPDQQAKVDAQLKHETAVRQRVREVSARLRRGSQYILSLARGPPTDPSQWMSTAVLSLMAALSAGGDLVVDDELFSAFIACSSKVSDRVGTMRPFIGIATLRSLRNAAVPEHFVSEPLGDLVTRVLYRLRFAAEQRPFDTASMAYMLPLVFAVLDQGGVGELSSEDADAQVLLAMEFLSFQMSSCDDRNVSREDIIKHLISAMQHYPQHHRLMKDCLTEMCKAISETIGESELDILLASTTAPQSAVRAAVLQAIESELDLTNTAPSVNIWIACQDEEDENAETALSIWEESSFSMSEELVKVLPAFLYSPARSTRTATAKALAQALLVLNSQTPVVVDQLKVAYAEEAKPLAPKANKYGIIQKGDLVDQWERRSGLALAFRELSTVYDQSMIVPILDFFVNQGPLADRHSAVRAEMVEAGKVIVATRGKDSLEPLMKLFEGILQQPDKGTQEFDWNNEAVIVLYGSVAQHLPESDKRTETVVSKLIDTLSTPSESVQYAVAQCLPPLVRPKSVDVSSNITALLEQLFEHKKYAARRGAAYGLAGIIKGKGVAALRQYRVMSSLRSASENKKSAEHRQGALFAYELMSLLLGRMFEPYVVEILPQLLGCFGDPNAGVREACLDTAKTCFASLSSFGVRKVLPQLLEGLDETQWRSKKGACDLLGAMAYLDPQQLATSLPDIIPPLTAVLTDSHKEVRSAANNSLQRFGEVITNPEVKSLVNVLLKALSDPTKYTEEALDNLIKVNFIHYLDAPSLALVVRILERGLSDRSSTKRKAAQIIGSLAHLTEKRDIVVHLPILVNGLRQATVDPVPATRATASKALGSLVEKLGEDAFPDLIPSLMSSLRTETGAGDRLGSAQALSEVLAGLGTTRLEETLPSILQNVSSARATVREGFMTLFIFLPACFGNSFANYLGQIIPSVLSGLADEVEAIRETSLRAGRLLVKNFATKAIDLLLPELQRGLADDSHRIRLSSVELVGDLLFSLTGTSAQDDGDEDAMESAAQAGQSLLDVLGEERRNKVLSSIYICRCDTSGLVRSAAINVWKALVATPKTLREIVPTLIQMIIGRLASSNMEHKVIAGNALGEVIRKAGEGVFTSLLPSLEEGLQTSTDADQRQGICIALREIVNAASPDSLEDNEKQLISIVRVALVDSDDDVREAAAGSFDALQQTFGKRAVDQVLPHLLSLLRSDDEADNALSALLTLLTETTRANVILPNLVPTLLVNPITSFNARALASLAKVGGSSMTRRLPAILNNLADNIVGCKDDELKVELDSAFDAVLTSVDEYDGLNTAMSVMLTMVKHDDHRKRAVAAKHLANFFAASEVDYSRYNQDLIRVLLISFGDRDKDVVQSAWSALSQLQSHIRKEEMEALVGSTRQTLQQAGTAGSMLPGFALPKGMLPVLQIFLQGLMNGTQDQRVQAAMGISDIIDRSSADSLKPFVTQITGPLIRVVGERSLEVKCAILFTLNQLLEKIPTFLRPFLPQLQRTFTKSIADPSSALLRQRATKALSTLITLTPRVDPLIAELVTGAKTPDAGVRSAMLKALQEVVSKVGGAMSDTSREAILALMDQNQPDTTSSTGDSTMETYARLLGGMIKVLPAEKAGALIRARVLLQPAATPASILALNACLLDAPASLLDSYADETRSTITNALSSPKGHFIAQNAVLAAGKYLLIPGTLEKSEDEEDIAPLMSALAAAIQPPGDIDTRRLALVVTRTVARHHHAALQQFLGQLAPAVFASVRDAVIPIKLAAEAAFLALFNVVDEEGAVFDAFMKEGPGKGMPVGGQRAMGDYFKRVALRLGAQARERREAEGGAGGLGLSGDEVEDEREVWSVGRVDLGEGGFEE